MARSNIEFSYNRNEGPKVRMGGRTLFLMLLVWSTVSWSSAAFFGYNVYEWLNFVIR